MAGQAADRNNELPRLGAEDGRARAADRALRERTRAVIPGGMYGHQAAGSLPSQYPQFMGGGRGSRVWDADGNAYVDLLCSYGPVVLGHRHPAVEGRHGSGDRRAGRLQAGTAPVAALLLDVRDRVLDHLDHDRHLPASCGRSTRGPRRPSSRCWSSRSSISA
jgi:glutamate-1-semialdehyde 2,1-aminomutase